MTETMKRALRDLVDRAQGYNATPELILQVALEHKVEAWKLEGFYFDELEAAGDW